TIEIGRNCVNAGGGSRTHTPVARERILNPSRLPIPPHRLGVGLVSYLVGRLVGCQFANANEVVRSVIAPPPPSEDELELFLQTRGQVDTAGGDADFGPAQLCAAGLLGDAVVPNLQLHGGGLAL